MNIDDVVGETLSFSSEFRVCRIGKTQFRLSNDCDRWWFWSSRLKNHPIFLASPMRLTDDVVARGLFQNVQWSCHCDPVCAERSRSSETICSWAVRTENGGLAQKFYHMMNSGWQIHERIFRVQIRFVQFMTSWCFYNDFSPFFQILYRHRRLNKRTHTYDSTLYMSTLKN